MPMSSSRNQQMPSTSNSRQDYIIIIGAIKTDLFKYLFVLDGIIASNVYISLYFPI